MQTDAGGGGEGASTTGGVDVEGLLLAGEEPRGRAGVGDATLVLTSHRLLVVRPAGDPRFRAVDRPNVLGVARGTTSDAWALTVAVQALALGAVLAVGGSAVSLDGLAGSVEAPSDTGMDGVFATVDWLLTLLSLLDDALLVGGALVLAGGLALLGWWVRTRERVLVVSVSGDDDVRLSLPDDDALDRVRRLLGDVTG